MPCENQDAKDELIIRLKARIMDLEQSLHKARCVFTARLYTPRGANINHQAESQARSWCLIHKCWADEHQIIGASHEIKT